MSQKLSDLTDTLVRDCLGYSGGNLVVIGDERTKHIADSVVSSAESLDGAASSRITYIDFDKWRLGKPVTSLQPEMAEELLANLDSQDPDRNVLLFMQSALDGETGTRKEILKLGESRGKVGGLVNCTEDVLEAGLHPENRGFSDELHEFLSKEREILIMSEDGTDLNVWLDHQEYDLVNSNGRLLPGLYGNPIKAEVYAHPKGIRGRLVIRGSYGPLLGFGRFAGNFGALVEALDKNPIIWEIEEGKIKHVRCGDGEIERFVRRYVFEEDPEHGRKIGEVGFPANLYVLARPLTGNLIIDEKGRVHLANGHGYKKRTRCKYDTHVHGDGLIASANLFSVRLGEYFMADNVYSPEIFKSLRR